MARKATWLLLPALLWLAAWAVTGLFASEPEAPPQSLSQVLDRGLGGEALGSALGAESATPAGLDRDQELLEARLDRQQVGTADPRQPAEGPTIQVFGGDPAEPVAGAEVRWVERRTAQRRRDGLLPLQENELPELLGARARTDEGGEFQLPPVVAATLVSAHHEGRFAFAVLEAGQRGEVRMFLRPDESITLEVRDAEGRPMPTAPVAVFQGARFDEARPVWSGVTDANGTRTVKHFQEWRAGDLGNRFAAVLQVPNKDVVAVEFPGAPLPEEPVQLQMPATGRLEIIVTDQGGNPILSECQLSIGASRKQPLALDLPVSNRADWTRQSKALGEEPVVFPYVGLGLELATFLRHNADERGSRRQVLRGPREPGEVVRVALPIGPEFAVLAAQLALPDRQPFQGSTGLSLMSVKGVLALGRINTLEDGRGDFLLRADTEGLALNLDLRAEREEDAWGLRLPIGPIGPGMRRDLGSLVLRNLEEVARGVVVDDLGIPVLNASVRLQQFVQRGDKADWVDAPLARTSTDSEGRFRLACPVPPAAIRLQVQAANHFAKETDPFAPGIELAIQLDRHGVLVGCILLPEWMPRDAATLTLVSQNDRKRNRTVPLRTRRNGQFAVGALVPDRYDLTITVRNFSEPLFQLGGIQVAPGDNRDPRLANLDLRNWLYRYALTAVGPRGEQLTDVNGPILMRTQLADGSKRETGFRWRSGKAELITPAPYIDVVAFGVGYQPTVANLNPGEQTLYMHKFAPAVFRTPGLRSLVGPDRKVRVSVVYKGNTGFPEGVGGIDQRTGEKFAYSRWELSRSSGGWLDGSDFAEVPMSRGGPHDIVLRIYENAREDSRQENVSLGVVNVDLEGPGARPYVLSLDPRRVQAALRRLHPPKR